MSPKTMPRTPHLDLMSPEGGASRVQRVEETDGRFTLNTEQTAYSQLMTANIESMAQSNAKNTVHKRVEPHLVLAKERLERAVNDQLISVSPSATDDAGSIKMLIEPMSGSQSKSVTPIKEHLDESADRISATDEYQTHSLSICNTARNNQGMLYLT